VWNINRKIGYGVQTGPGSWRLALGLWLLPYGDTSVMVSLLVPSIQKSWSCQLEKIHTALLSAPMICVFFVHGMWSRSASLSALGNASRVVSCSIPRGMRLDTGMGLIQAILMMCINPRLPLSSTQVFALLCDFFALFR
jgi:hypothetical protein